MKVFPCQSQSIKTGKGGYFFDCTEGRPGLGGTRMRNFLSRKLTIQWKKNQKINHKRNKDFYSKATSMKHTSINPLVQILNTETLEPQLAFYYLNKSREHSMNSKHLNKRRITETNCV